MEETVSDFEYFSNKRSDRVYLSKSLSAKLFLKDDIGEIKEFVRPFRIVSKVIDCQEDHKFIKDGKKVSLRITPGGRQEITAKFYEDTRGISTLQIQKYSTETGAPHNCYFTFVGDEISILYNFIRNIAILPIKDKSKMKLDDKFVEELILSKEQALELVTSNPDLLDEIIKNRISTTDIVQLGHRKKQLQVFDSLLSNDNFFKAEKDKFGTNKRDEDVWQNFFENNTWIFGYGLNYIFNTPLENEKLEQVVKGGTVFDSGKRVDGLLKTRGIVSSLCFAEIKTHKTPLLKMIKTPYRGESWAASDDLSGGIAQIQKTVQKSIENIKTKTQVKNKQGDLTREELFLYKPKSFLLIGSHASFQGDFGINEDKFSSFELFRQSIQNPEIITFDELFERAKYIVETNESRYTTNT